MTATPNEQTGRKERPEPSAEAAAELVRTAKEQGLSLTAPDSPRDEDRQASAVPGRRPTRALLCGPGREADLRQTDQRLPSYREVGALATIRG